mgnify:CR=1 FL=1
MKRNLIVLLTILVCGLTACKPGQKKEEDMEKETKLKIETSAGDITVKLYNETPKTLSSWWKTARMKVRCSTVSSRTL